MKYLCTACERLLELSRFRVEGGELVVQCERCGAESRATLGQAELSRAANSAGGRPNVLTLRPVLTGEASDFTAVPGGYCPKCIALRVADSPSCAQCGLVYGNFRAEELSFSEELAAAWRALVPQWSQPEQHDAFLALALRSGELAAAGRLYRIRLVRDPEDALAQRGRDEVVRLALIPSIHGLDGGPRARALVRRRVKLLALALVLLFVLGVLLTLAGLGR
jgi:hypothetical protein